MSRLLNGPNAVLSALDSGSDLRRVSVAEGEVGTRLREVLGRAQEAGIPVSRLSRRDLDRLADGGHHQGVVAEAPPYAYASLDDIAEALVAAHGNPQAGRPSVALALDGVQDPHNLGAILRSAAAFGVAGVIIPEHGACEVTPAAERSSVGAASRVRVARVTNLAKALDQLKASAQAWVATADAHGGDDPANADPPYPLILVMGSESKGVRPGVAKRGDLSLTLPLARPEAVESLNVSVATAVLLYALTTPG